MRLTVTKSDLPTGKASTPGPAHPQVPAWLLALLLALLTIAIYWPATQCQFITLDDQAYVTANPRVQQGLTWEGVKWVFFHTVNANWHPLTMLSYMLDCQLYGLNPWGHHLTNVLLHGANTALVFLLLRYLTGACWRSMLVAACFGWHPSHVESVAWVSERKDVLSTLFGLLSLVFYARFAKSKIKHQISKMGSYLLACLFLALGLMSKPMLVTWPFVMLLLDYWPLGRFRQAGVWRLVIEKVPFFALAAAASVVTFAVQKHSGGVMSVGFLPIGARCGNALISYCDYLGKIFWPASLAVIYPYPGYLPAREVLGAGLLLAVITAAAWRKRQAWPFVLMGWLWFCGTLVPVIGLVQAGGQSMADRYLYVPSLGVFILVIFGLYELIRQRPYPIMAMAVVLGVASCSCIGLTRRQLGYWRDSETLMVHALAVTRNNYMAQENLGCALLEQGRLDEAVRQFQEAIRLNPLYAEAHFNYGNALEKKGDLDGAIRQFQAAIKLDPNANFVEAHNNLGGALDKKGEHEAATRQYQEAIRLDPNYADAYYNLGNTLSQEGRLDEAIGQYQTAIRLNPGYADAHNNLGIVLYREGRLAEATRQFQEAIRLKPDYAEAHYNFGLELYRQGRLDDVITQFQDAVRFKPDYVDAYNNLGMVLYRKGRLEEAIRQFQEAIRLNPDYADAHHNLGIILYRQGRLDEAIAEFQVDLRLNPNDADARGELARALQMKQTPAGN